MTGDAWGCDTHRLPTAYKLFLAPRASGVGLSPFWLQPALLAPSPKAGGRGRRAIEGCQGYTGRLARILSTARRQARICAQASHFKGHFFCSEPGGPGEWVDVGDLGSSWARTLLPSVLNSVSSWPRLRPCSLRQHHPSPRRLIVGVRGSGGSHSVAVPPALHLLRPVLCRGPGLNGRASTVGRVRTRP